MADTTIEEVGLGTQAQVEISMQPLTGTDGNDYSLSELTWNAYFEGASQYKVMSTDTNLLWQDADTCLCLVDTSKTGRGEIKAWLEVTDIPSINGTVRKEVTPPVTINLKAV